MKKIPVVAIAGIISAAVMFGWFCQNVEIGSLRIKVKAPGIYIESELRKEDGHQSLDNKGGKK